MFLQVHSASLFRCSHCEVFFKSKKGYEGHLQNKHGPKVVGSDGKPKSRKEMQGLNKVEINQSVVRSVGRPPFITRCRSPAQLPRVHPSISSLVLHFSLVHFQVLKEIQSKKEAEMVQKIIAQVKAECEAKGADIERRGYTKHY